MAISGRADASTVEIRTEWDERGRPLQTVLELRPSRPIDQRHHLSWSEGRGDAPDSELPLEALARGARGLDVGRDAVQIFLPAPLADPLEELDRISALADLGQRLEGRLGVYR